MTALSYAGPSAKLALLVGVFGEGNLDASLNAGKQATACVMYYGMPVDDVEKLKTLNCDVLNFWPTQYKYIKNDVMNKFEANMKAAGKNLTVKPYEVDHAFANPSNSMGYNEAAANDAYQNTLAFFKARLK